jgi:cell division septation protein DedD
MRRSSSFIWFIVICGLCIFPASHGVSSTGSVSDFSAWDVASYKVKLLDHRGGSGDIQSDQNGWIHLGANHLEGGDIKYEVPVGNLSREDILEVWIDGYSTSTDLNMGPTVFIGSGKNRYEQITRNTGDAWRPFVFRFADDTVYGDVTDPSNRNEMWRTRFPSSKYELRRIDKSPRDLLENGVLPVRVSMTGAEDYIIKRIEIAVSRSRRGLYGEGLYIVSLEPYTVRRGDMITVRLNSALPSEDVDFYIIDPSGRESRVAPRILGGEGDRVGFYTDEYLLSKSGQYQLKLVDRTDRDREHVDIERFEYIRSKIFTPAPESTPPIQSPAVECPPTMLPPVPQAPSGYMMPMPVPVPSVGVPVPDYSRGYTIQIGAFQVQSTAIALQDRLRREGYDAYILESMSKGRRVFRVRVGRYPTKSLALRDANRLKSRGFDTWVTELS